MCTLCARQRCWHEVRVGREALIYQHLHPLGTQQLLAHPSMKPPTPITPKQGRGTHDEGMQEHTRLTRFRRSTALPLTLFSQRARTATADAGSVHHTQASISFPASLMGDERLASGTAQRAIRLQGKVATGETTRLPGRGDFGRSIALDRRSQIGSRSLPSQMSGSKLGGAHGIREQVMAQFQAEVPDPLADDLPALLTPGGMAAPTVGFLLAIF